MKNLIVLFAAILWLSSIAAAQPAKSLSREEREILRVFDEYTKAMQFKQPERDAVRQRLLTADYFYMGMDGLPAAKDHVMARQKRNGLLITSMQMTDIRIRRYGDTAILTMRSAGAGLDFGQPWGGDGKQNGHTTVMVKQNGKWLIAADIIGVEVEEPKKPS